MLRRWVTPVAGFVASAVALTWPLALRLGSRLPLGTERSATVPLFNLWTMEWNGARFARAYRGYWNAPIFHPTRGAFAFSDPQPLTGLVAWVLHGAVSAVAAYGLVLVLALVLNGVAAMGLARRLGAPPGAAWLAGLLAQALPFVFNELGVLQLVMIFTLLFALGALHDLDRAPTWRSGLRLGAWIGVAFLTSEYYALFLLVTLALGVPILLGRRLVARASLVALGTSAALALVIAAPLLLPQAHYTAPYRWTTATVRANSASLGDYARLDPASLGGAVAPWLRAGGDGERLYPGTGLELLAVAGFAIARATGRRRWATFLGVGVLLGLLLSLGLTLTIGSFSPYSVLRDHVPGFSRLRSPFRFAVVSQVLLVALASVALARLWEWRGRTGRLVAAALVAVSVVEVAQVPTALARGPREPAALGWVRYLRRHPGGAVAMVPFPASASAEAYQPTTVAMLDALEHGHPLVNGYSGFFPSQYLDLNDEMVDFPASGLEALAARGVRWVVVDGRRLRDERRSELDNIPELAAVFRDGGTTVYRLDISAGAGG